MDFKLTHPCRDCPFRTDIDFPLAPGRAREIAESLEAGSFPCHKTVDYGLDDLVDQLNDGTQHCAGAAIMRLKMHKPGRMLQIAQRMDLCDLSSYDLSAPVFDDAADFIGRRSGDYQRLHARNANRRVKDSCDSDSR